MDINWVRKAAGLPLMENLNFNDENLQAQAQEAMDDAVTALSRETDDVTKEAVMAWLEPRVSDDVYRVAWYMTFGGKMPQKH